MTTTTKPVRWGILACGTIAHAFAKALKEAEGSELHAVAARDAGRAQTFAAEHGGHSRLWQLRSPTG
jgi:predicted dehydrogenase